jgi:aspartyl-tRNA(Asn)/glutamyl-tRNA(Gln) amidotransferase subunit A
MTKSWSDIKSLQSLYRAKEIKPSEVVGWYLERINRLNSSLNVYLTVTSELAQNTAKAQDDLLAKDPSILDRNPMFGVPLAHKDLFMTKGVRTTAGSKVLEEYTAKYDSTVVSKLSSAGAILLGKLNCDAWAHGSSGENSDFGPAKNPWNPQYVPGGSSSGSGAAVAADMALVGTGTDTGGSIRAPASFCGVVGLKPTYGRVSRYGVIAMASSLDSIGHLTKNVQDSARVLEITAGKDINDATTSPQPVDNYSKEGRTDLSELKIGVPEEYLKVGSKLTAGMDDEVVKLTQAALEKLKALGAQLIEVSLPHTPEALATYYIIQPAEVSSNLGRYDGVRFGNSRDSFGPEAKRRIMLGTYTLSAGYYDAYYKTALKVRTLIVDDFKKAFTKVDLLVAPVMPHLPFPIGIKAQDPLALYLEDVLTVPMNIAGIPAISVPAGLSSQGLPFGIQFIGPQFSEKSIFDTARVYEANTKWHTLTPNLG